MVSEGSLWLEQPVLRSVRGGDVFSPELLRRGLRELEQTGRFAELRVEVADSPGGLLVLYRVRPRRLVARVRFEGRPGDVAGLDRRLGLAQGDEITDTQLTAAETRIAREYERAGYPRAEVRITADDTDDPMRKLVRVHVDSGPPELVQQVAFRVAPSPAHPDLIAALSTFQVQKGARLARERVDEAVTEFNARLFSEHFYEAEVTATRTGPGVLQVEVLSGPKFTTRIEGAQTFGTSELEAELALAGGGEVVPSVLEERLERFYVSHGFLDARVVFDRRDAEGGLRSELVGWIREGERFTVVERHFPCAGATRTSRQLSSEVDGVLKERFPGLSIFHPPDGQALDAALGTSSPSPRATPLPPRPYTSYSEEAYMEVRRHLEELYRADGYLRASVGPVTLLRAECTHRDGSGECVAGPLPALPPDLCAAPTAQATELERVRQTCIPDEARGVACAPTGVVVLPIHPGPQTILHDVALRGNREFTESQLLELANLPVGRPARSTDIEASLRRISDLYADEGFAFAVVDSEMELSPDGTRARLSIIVTERQRVRIARVDIVGAERTRQQLIRKRLAIRPGDIYRRADAVRSQEQVESLGMYTSVAVALADPGVPSREKVVVVTVTERRPQYVDIKGGFATADGFRIGFEYGHRNLARSAIQLSIRSQLNLRPVFLIPEADVRQRYEVLAGREGLHVLLERRNMLGLTFPEIGLGPRVRLETELLDMNDNNRDYRQQKEAAVVQVSYRALKNVFLQAGGTLELNDANIFESLDAQTAGQVRVATGQSLAVTQNVRGTWDRRDRALSARRGTYLGLTVEHVTAWPTDETYGTCNNMSLDASVARCSELMRYSGRLAGYIPFSKRGLTLAISIRSGIIQHLTQAPNPRASTTYPDRLFYAGGVDTIRGYPQDSLVPQDLADRILDPDDELTVADVALRGGDFFIAPRAELRIPLFGSLETAIFLDAGNVWTDPRAANLLELRYALGTGLRVDTPVGPLVFDYGFNLERVLSEFGVDLDGVRPWEDLGAFHFSIGLF